MKTITTLFLAITLAACGSNPTKTSFPDVPPKLMDKPAELKIIMPDPVDTKLTDITPSGVELSAVTKVMTDNYKTCNLYKAQIEGLQNWIAAQKSLNP